MAKEHTSAKSSRNDAEEPETGTEVEQEERQAEQIYQTGSVTPEGGRHKIHCLTIIGQVEGHYILPPQNKTTKYEHVIPQLVAIEQDDSIKGLLILLNTVGGDVEAGLAIAELVAGMKKPTVSLVLGGGHSIGVPLAVSARYSFIAPTATMTVHPVRMNGLMLGVPQTLSYFDKMQERISSFVCENSNISPDRFKHLMMNNGELVMDIGTVLDGEAAVKEGLIDSLGSLHDAVSKLYDFIDEEEAAAERDGKPKDPEPPRRRGRPAGKGGKKSAAKAPEKEKGSGKPRAARGRKSARPLPVPEHADEADSKASADSGQAGRGSRRKM